MKKPNQFGKYFLFDRINGGGMAEIFRAKSFGLEGSERIVALKKMIPMIADDKELVSMFIDEAKLAVQLNHPSICQVFDWGKVEDSYFIAMEYIAGRDLRSVAQRCKQQLPDGTSTMPMAQACMLMMKLCEALDYAHSKKDSLGNDLQLVHRDVSPQNVMVSYEGEVKLIDFGVAKVQSTREAKTEAGVLKGKFAYMSPEQVRGEAIDRRSDIFASGIVLYELLTGERLFPMDNDLAVLEKIKNVEILPPTAYNRRIPEELERIVMKALSPSPAERYQQAMDMHADLQAYMYTSGEFYSRKELSAWMKRVFRAEHEAEQTELEAVREFRPVSTQQQAASEPLARARATMSMAALRVPGEAGSGLRGAKETGAIGALSASKATGTVRALGSDSGAPSSWTPSKQKKAPASSPPPGPKNQAGSIAEAAASMGRPADAVRATRPPVSAPPRPMPPRQPVTEVELEGDTSVDGPRGLKRASQPSYEQNTAATQAYRQHSRAELDGYEGDTRAFAQQGPDAGDVETRAFGQLDSGAVPLPADEGPTMANPPGALPSSITPTSAPTMMGVPTPRSVPMMPAQPRHEAMQSRALPLVQPPQLFTPPTVDLGQPTPVAAPQRRSMTPWLLLLLLLLVGAGGGAYWFMLRPGELIIVAEPGRELTVLVDQRAVALTDSPVRLRLPPGVHAVKVQHPGHLPWTESLTMTAGEAVVRDIKLESATPKTGGFTLLSEPAGATAILDGSPLGQVTPMRVQSVVAGAHNIELRLGNRVWKQAITIEPGKLLDIHAQLPNEDGTTPTPPTVATTVPPSSPTATPPATGTPPTATQPATPAVTGAAVAANGKPAQPEAPPTAIEKPAAVPQTPVAPEKPAAVAAVKPPVTRPVRPRPQPKPPVGKPAVAVNSAFSYLRINSKPWSKIILDGVDTGMNTPQLSFRVTPGRHTITLLNPQFNIKESFTVTLSGGETQTVIKDFLR